MKRIISVLICSLALSGCATLKKELVVRTKPVEKPKLDVPMPQPVKMQSIQWVIITDKNYNDVIESVKDSNGLDNKFEAFTLTELNSNKLTQDI